MDAPDREHVRRVPTADEDQVVPERQLAQVLRRPGKELDAAHLRTTRVRVVDPQRLRRVLAARRRHEQDFRPFLACQPEEMLPHGLGRGAAADREDLLLHRRMAITRPPGHGTVPG